MKSNTKAKNPMKCTEILDPEYLPPLPRSRPPHQTPAHFWEAIRPRQRTRR